MIAPPQVSTKSINVTFPDHYFITWTSLPGSLSPPIVE